MPVTTSLKERNQKGFTLISVVVGFVLLLASFFAASMGIHQVQKIQSKAEAMGEAYDLERYLSFSVDCTTTVTSVTSCSGEVIPLWKKKGASCQAVGDLQPDNTMKLGSIHLRARCTNHVTNTDQYWITLEKKGSSGSWEPLRPDSSTPRNLICTGKEIVFRSGWEAGLYLWGAGHITAPNLPPPGKSVGLRRDHPPTIQALCNIFGLVPANVPGYDGDGRFSTPHDDFIHWYNTANNTWTITRANQPPVNNDLWEGFLPAHIALRCELPTAKRCP